MLTRDRPAMAKRAVESFRAQTYGNKSLLIWDTGPDHEVRWLAREFRVAKESIHHVEDVPDFSIGELRNRANDWPHAREADIIVHWDDDDWSHPNRIAEQVALLQSSGADAVGYREMLFWRDIQLSEHDVYGDGGDPSRPCDVIEEAWLYSHSRPDYALGTSLCYWRKTWERKPFPDLPKGPGATGEDHEWQQQLRVVSKSACKNNNLVAGFRTITAVSEDFAPRMIASIHGGNSSKAYDIEALLAKGNKQWRRTPEWDYFCRMEMRLW